MVQRRRSAVLPQTTTMSVNLMAEVITDCKRRRLLMEILNNTQETSQEQVLCVGDQTNWEEWIGDKMYLELVRRLTRQSEILLDMYPRRSHRTGRSEKEKAVMQV